MPPSTITLHILQALAVQDLTVPELSHQIAIDTQRGVLIADSSLYRAVSRLQAEGLIMKVGTTRRYTLASPAHLVLRQEKTRFSHIAHLLRTRT
jgi:DNA-binding IclR family transcriptional regulator